MTPNLGKIRRRMSESILKIGANAGINSAQAAQQRRKSTAVLISITPVSEGPELGAIATDSTPNLGAKRRVSFPCTSLVQSVIPAPEYDRKPAFCKPPRGPARDAVYDELIEFHEKEMEVHPEMQHTTLHPYLWGDDNDTRIKVRRKLSEANRIGGFKPKPKPRSRSHSTQPQPTNFAKFLVAA